MGAGLLGEAGEHDSLIAVFDRALQAHAHQGPRDTAATLLRRDGQHPELALARAGQLAPR